MFSFKWELPVDYTKLKGIDRASVRLQYIEEQEGLCYYCGCDLYKEPPKHIKDKKINWKLFPKGFLKYPIHLQHDHNTGMTEGAVHALCNAVMWQYEGK